MSGSLSGPKRSNFCGKSAHVYIAQHKTPHLQFLSLGLRSHLAQACFTGCHVPSVTCRLSRALYVSLLDWMSRAVYHVSSVACCLRKPASLDITCHTFDGTWCLLAADGPRACVEHTSLHLTIKLEAEMLTLFEIAADDQHKTSFLEHSSLHLTTKLEAEVLTLFVIAANGQHVCLEDASHHLTIKLEVEMLTLIVIAADDQHVFPRAHFAPSHHQA